MSGPNARASRATLSNSQFGFSISIAIPCPRPRLAILEAIFQRQLKLPRVEHHSRCAEARIREWRNRRRARTDERQRVRLNFPRSNILISRGHLPIAEVVCAIHGPDIGYVRPIQVIENIQRHVDSPLLAELDRLQKPVIERLRLVAQ